MFSRSGASVSHFLPKTIAGRFAMSSNSVAFSIDPRAVMARRVLPLTAALLLWVVVIDSVRLLTSAL
jgi:hypothetical protein